MINLFEKYVVQHNISIFQGDDVVYTIEPIDQYGNSYNFSGLTATMIVPENPAYNRSTEDQTLELGDGYVRIYMNDQENIGPKNTYKYKIKFTTQSESFPFDFPVDFDAEDGNDGLGRVLIVGNLTIQ